MVGALTIKDTRLKQPFTEAIQKIFANNHKNERIYNDEKNVLILDT